MKARTLCYLVLGILGAAVAVAVPVSVYRSGSGAVPLWAEATVPGPISAAHEFIGAVCETCHVPLRGVEQGACLGCHAVAASELVSKPATAFHASIGECAGCHVEHLGRDRRPINMNHAALAVARHSRALWGSTPADTAEPDAVGHSLSRIRALLAESGAALTGSPPSRRPLPLRDTAVLDCAGCHATRDTHRTLFGRDCQSCHQVESWAIASFRHPSSRSRDCAQCHQAPPSHYMMHFEMMDRRLTGQREARVEQCYLCHQTDSWNNIRGAGWIDMH